MEFSIQRPVLLEGIQKTLSIVEKRTTFPILNNVLIQTQVDQIRIIATDREVGLTAAYPATIINQGEITVGARKLFEMIREIDGDEIHVQVMDNNWVNVTCGKIVYKIPGISAEDFPTVSELGEMEQVEMPCRVLQDVFEKTFFAISQDEMRPNLNGIFFQVSGQNLEVVATDGHRLSLVNTPFSDNNQIVMKGVIIPRKGVSEIRKLVDEGDSVDVGVMDGVFVVKKRNLILRVSLINAEYPNYEQVIPEERGVVVHLDREKVLHSLRRMSVMSTEKFSGVKIQIYDNRMVLTSTNPDVGEARDEVDVSYSGEMLEVGYSVRYLIDAMEPIDGDVVSFEMRSGDGPGMVRSAENDRYLCVVMPIKLRKD